MTQLVLQWYPNSSKIFLPILPEFLLTSRDFKKYKKYIIFLYIFIYYKIDSIYYYLYLLGIIINLSNLINTSNKISKIYIELFQPTLLFHSTFIFSLDARDFI